jgi:hypothetical protein
MLDLTEWIARYGEDLRSKPWMILGKGPSFAERDKQPLHEFHLLTLNHSIRDVHAKIAHIVDIDVVHDCEDILVERCDYLVMPRYPNVQGRSGFAALEEYFPASAALRTLDADGRLVWYNISTAHTKVGSSPVIPARYFGSEPALALLGEIGCTTVRSLGIDGGTGYASSFAGDAALTHLANGQPSFDMQFGELRSIAARYGLDYRPQVEPFRVFVGTTPAEMVAFRVLAHSIHRHSSIPVTVEPLTSVRSPRPRDKANQPRTNFSFARFHIPDLCGHRGRALYVDSDMLVFGDIAELAAHSLDGAWLACTTQGTPEAWEDNSAFTPGRQFSVMLLDCSQLKWDIAEIVGQLDDGVLTYERLMFDMAIVPDDLIADDLPTAWNSLEQLDEATKLLHYTVVPSQPWVSTKNPLRDVWLDAFRDAVADRAVPRAEVERLVTAGGRPDLLEIFDQVWTPPAPAFRNVAEVALTATRRELEALQARRVRRKVWRITRHLLHRSGRFEDQARAARRAVVGLRRRLQR